MEKRFKALIKKIKDPAQKRLAVISYWIADFPCDSYFGTKEKCILEYITPEELNKIIGQKCQRKR